MSYSRCTSLKVNDPAEEVKHRASKVCTLFLNATAVSPMKFIIEGLNFESEVMV